VFVLPVRPIEPAHSVSNPITAYGSMAQEQQGPKRIPATSLAGKRAAKLPPQAAEGAFIIQLIRGSGAVCSRRWARWL
jgi:hypothetical protein